MHPFKAWLLFPLWLEKAPVTEKAKVRQSTNTMKQEISLFLIGLDLCGCTDKAGALAQKELVRELGCAKRLEVTKTN